MIFSRKPLNEPEKTLAACWIRLKCALNTYLDYLLIFINDEIRLDTVLRVQYGAQGRPYERIQELISDFDDYLLLENSADYLCTKNESFLLLLDKAKVILELKQTLVSPKLHDEERLQELINKLIHGEEILQKSGEYGYSPFINRATNFFGLSRPYRTYMWDSTEGELQQQLWHVLQDASELTRGRHYKFT